MKNISPQTVPEQIRDIKRLKEPFQTKVRHFLAEMKALGDEMGVHETFRTAERQKWLVENGKSWVKVSNHQLGLAADVHFKIYPHFPALKDKRWRKAWNIAKKHGIDNGFDLWGTDGNHLQDDGTLLKDFEEKKDEKTEKTRKITIISSKERQKEPEKNETSEKRVIQAQLMTFLPLLGSLWAEMKQLEDVLAEKREKMHVLGNMIRKIAEKEPYDVKTAGFVAKKVTR